MVNVFVEIGMSLKNYTGSNINVKQGNSSYNHSRKV